jgi:UDP-N-acetylglucosamine 2-epimerase (non-hydrolysing)
VFGTRPEYIKLHGVFTALAQASVDPAHVHLLCTSQHPDLLDATALLAHDFPVHVLPSPMAHQQPLNLLLSKMLAALDPVMATLAPTLTIVQGDTTSTLAGALAAFQRGCPIAHIEAGLRTPDLCSPFPEEANRRLISTLATHHYAPTQAARQNLLAEGVQDNAIHVTGNTSIDRLYTLTSMLPHTGAIPRELVPHAESNELVFMTLHRRDNIARLPALLAVIAALIKARPDVHLVWPRHPHPDIMRLSAEQLGDLPNVTLLPAVSHLECVALMNASKLVITDSGGLQEEATTLGVPVVVVRAHTDRPEAIEQGFARLAVGTPDQVHHVLVHALDEPFTVGGSCTLYGDGHAGERIVSHMLGVLGETQSG